MSEALDSPIRRRGKEIRERVAAAALLLIFSPVFVLCALLIKLEGLFSPRARGPVFFKEQRMSRGRVFQLIKFRTLTRSALEGLGSGPTHIKLLENKGQLTRVGATLRQWYLDELPQLWNIVKGDMFLIGTRPWPIELYEQHLEQGLTYKRDMPAGLIGIVQSSKGAPQADQDSLDGYYWEAFRTWPWWKLLLLDVQIVARSAKVQLEHKGL